MKGLRRVKKVRKTSEKLKVETKLRYKLINS